MAWGLLAATCLLLPRAAQAGWAANPWLTLSGGYENSRLRLPDLDRYAVPGGGLVGVMPGIRVGGWLAEGVRLDATGQVGCEGFANSDRRAVIGAVVDADLRVRLPHGWSWRTSVAANRYSDSAYETADRTGGGLEAGLGHDGAGWSLELFGGLDGRRYEDLLVEDRRGRSNAYTESGLGLGLAGSARAGERALFSARVLRQRTDARDPLYDADSWLAQASARGGLGLDVFLTVSALAQLRTFTARPVAADDDSYWQVGVGLDRGVTASARLAVRYAYARAVEPPDAAENLHRGTLALTWGLGPAPRVSGVFDLGLPVGPAAPVIREADGRVFRCHAPGAREVALVGDFNRWDPSADPMVPVADGWWQVEVRLPAGSHAYAYLVDGTTITPADAEIVVDDGFGGRNGLIRVEPGGS